MKYKDFSEFILGLLVPFKWLAIAIAWIIHKVVFGLVGILFGLKLIAGRTAGKVAYAIIFIVMLGGIATAIGLIF